MCAREFLGVDRALVLIWWRWRRRCERHRYLHEKGREHEHMEPRATQLAGSTRGRGYMSRVMSLLPVRYEGGRVTNCSSVEDYVNRVLTTITQRALIN